MWHRLPLEKKIAPAGDPGSRFWAASRRRARPCGSPPGARRSARSRGGDPVRLGQRVPRARGRRPRLRDRRLRRHQPRLPGVRAMRAATSARSCGPRRAGRWRVGARRASSALLGAQRGTLDLARDVRDVVPLPPAWPVYVSHAEASAYARWKRPAAPDRGRVPPRRVRDARRRRALAIPGATSRRTRRAATSTSRAGIPCRSARYPAGTSAWGVHDLVGNGWEWTSTVFAPFPGLRADGVLSGVLGRLLRREALRDEGRLAGDREASSLRRSFRNWFRRNYPYVYATFRTRRD